MEQQSWKLSWRPESLGEDSGGEEWRENGQATGNDIPPISGVARLNPQGVLREEGPKLHLAWFVTLGFGLKLAGPDFPQI